MAFGAHAAVDEDLGNGVFGGVGLLALVGFGEAGDVVHRVVVADVLERAGNAGDEIFLADYGHRISPRSSNPSRVMDAVEGWRIGVSLGRREWAFSRQKQVPTVGLPT